MTLARSEDEKGDAGIQSEGSEDDDDDDRSEDLSVKFEKLKPPHDPSVTRWATRNQHLLQVRSRFACPSFPSFEHLERDRIDLPPILDTSSLRLRLRLTDYHGPTSTGGTWNPFVKWLKSLNFEVVRDHGAEQIGSSCGIVAARISSWLKESKPENNSNFMRLDTKKAVSREVLRHANSILRTYGTFSFTYFFRKSISSFFPCLQTNLIDQA